MFADESVSKLARYESLFQLSGKINTLTDIHQIGAAFASGLKYVADILAWRYLGIEDQRDTASEQDGALLVIDGYRGKATVSHVARRETSGFEQRLWETQKPVFLQGDELAQTRETLPKQFQDSVITQIYAHPQFGDDTLQSLFLCCAREKPFDQLDLKFVVLASLLFHGKIRHVQIEHRLVEELEKKLAALQRIRQMEDQLRVQEKMASLGNLVAGVAHETNTPLGAITSSQQTMARAVEKLRKALQEQARAGAAREDARSGSIESIIGVMETAAQAMTAGTARINRIVQNLMNFVRLDQAEFQEADLRQSIESVLNVLQAQMGDRITIVRNFGHVSPLYCSPGRLNQVFMHLIDNSIKAIKHEGVIEIDLSQDKDDVYVQIKDTGAGMPPGALQRIFDFRFSDAGPRVQMGFGLSLDYKIIQQHGGSMNIESEEGEGTQVTIRLPRARALDRQTT